MKIHNLSTNVWTLGVNGHPVTIRPGDVLEAPAGYVTGEGGVVMTESILCNDGVAQEISYRFIDSFSMGFKVVAAILLFVFILRVMRRGFVSERE